MSQILVKGIYFNIIETTGAGDNEPQFSYASPALAEIDGRFRYTLRLTEAENAQIAAIVETAARRKLARFLTP
jgi:hypothetical protein